MDPKIPKHGLELPQLEILAWVQNREVYFDDADNSIPIGAGTCQLIVRFGGGEPFPVIIDGKDFDSIFIQGLEKAQDKISKKKLTPEISRLAESFIESGDEETMSQLQKACDDVGLPRGFLTRLLSK